MLLHRNLIANALAVCEGWGWTVADRLLLALPLFHTYGLMVGVHGTLVSSGSLELHRRFEAASIYQSLVDQPVTMFFGVPTMYTRLLSYAAELNVRPKSRRLYVSGSAPFSPQTFEEFDQVFGQPILERYGMTETIMTLTNPYQGERRPGTVGLPFPGQAARVVDVRRLAPSRTARLRCAAPTSLRVSGNNRRPPPRVLTRTAGFGPATWVRSARTVTLSSTDGLKSLSSVAVTMSTPARLRKYWPSILA